MKKQAWEQPELVILVRGKPEEAILAGCKYVGAPRGSGANTSRDNCYMTPAGRTCTAPECSAMSAT